MNPRIPFSRPAVFAFACLGLGFAVSAWIPAWAQSSASYAIESSVLNSGGPPSNGDTMASAAYRITLDSLGEPLNGPMLASASYAMDAATLSAYRPPGEVQELLFADASTLDWAAEPAAGTYNVYRDTLSSLSDVYAGTCEQSGLVASNASDPGTPPNGDGWFYLVTSVNRLGEEGTRGADGAGTDRPDTGVCP